MTSCRADVDSYSIRNIHKLARRLVWYAYSIQFGFILFGTHIFWTAEIPSGDFRESMLYWLGDLGMAKSLIVGYMVIVTLLSAAIYHCQAIGVKPKSIIKIYFINSALLIYWFIALL